MTSAIESPGSPGARTDTEHRGESIESPGSAGARSDAEHRGESIDETADDPPAPRKVSPWNPANAVTASRFLTLPPLFWAIDHGYRQWATLFIIICGLLDKLDGLFARIFNCRSAFGEMFDALTDAACYGFALIVCAAYGWAPVVPVVLVISLGAINVLMRLVYTQRVGRAVNYKSYAMERIVAYTGYLVGFATGNMEVDFYYWAFPPVMFIILLHDAKRMLVDPV